MFRSWGLGCTWDLRGFKGMGGGVQYEYYTIFVNYGFRGIRGRRNEVQHTSTRANNNNNIMTDVGITLYVTSLRA